MATPVSSTTSLPVTTITFAPLTTTFSPPQQCFSQLTATINMVDQPPADYPYFIAGIHGDSFIPSSCYPPSWAPTAQAFSPGLCPSGCSAGCLNTRSLSTAIESGAICYPNSWFCDTSLYSWIGGASMRQNCGWRPILVSIF
jgi:hypothetical protein